MKPYNKLNETDFENIINTYYDKDNKDMTFDEMADKCNVSYRAFARVLKERGVNTKLKNRYVVKNENYFDNIDTEDKAYFLGLIFADGYVGCHNQLIISLKNTGNTKDIMQTLLNNIECDIDIKEFCPSGGFKTNNTFLKLQISNEVISNDLKKYGIGELKKDSRKSIPKCILDNGLERHFIRGLFDGDGSVSIKNKHMPVPQQTVSFMGNESVLSQVKEILESELSLNNVKMRKTKSEEISEIRYGGNKQCKRISDYLYSNTNLYLSHKYFSPL